MPYKFLVLIFIICLISCKQWPMERLNDGPLLLTNESVPIENTTSRIWDEGWLSVLENRHSSSGNLIELPYIFSQVNDSVMARDIPVLIMSGGPGNSSLHMANGVVNTPWGRDRNILVLEQRGTRYARPYLKCPEIDSLRILAMKDGLFGKSLDSIKLLGVQTCYDRFNSQNIDLEGYNTLESVEDIEDLRRSLGLDKMMLYGMSYSCNLMMAYAQKYPENTHALTLDSPLPHSSNYDEEAYQNIDRVLMRIVKHYSSSLDLYAKWKDYISSIRDSVFVVSIDREEFRYTKNELIDIVLLKMSAHESIPQTVLALSRIIEGDHAGIEEVVNANLQSGGQAKGMRYSLWISEELSEEREEICASQGKIYSWLDGYDANDVSFETARIWGVNTLYKNREWPTAKYTGPALILSGQFDPWTPEWYGVRVIKDFPNAQQIIYSERTHLPGFTSKGFEDIAAFMESVSN